MDHKLPTTEEEYIRNFFDTNPNDVNHLYQIQEFSKALLWYLGFGGVICLTSGLPSLDGFVSYIIGGLISSIIYAGNKINKFKAMSIEEKKRNLNNFTIKSYLKTHGEKSKYQILAKNDLEIELSRSKNQIAQKLHPHLELFAKAFIEASWDRPVALYPGCEINEEIFNEFILHLDDSGFKISRTGFVFSIYENILNIIPERLQLITKSDEKPELKILSEALLLKMLSREIVVIFREKFSEYCKSKKIATGEPSISEFDNTFDADHEYAFAYLDYKSGHQDIELIFNSLKIREEEFKINLIQLALQKEKNVRVTSFRERLQKGTFEDIYSQTYDIDIMEGYIFEHYIGKIFEKMGYKVHVTKRSGDQGADLVVENVKGKTVVQTKRYSDNVGNDAVQQVIAAKGFYSAKFGMVVTNQSFTKSAQELAAVHNIELWDRTKLEQMMKRYPVSKDELERIKKSA